MVYRALVTPCFRNLICFLDYDAEKANNIPSEVVRAFNYALCDIFLYITNEYIIHWQPLLLNISSSTNRDPSVSPILYQKKSDQMILSHLFAILVFK